LKSDLPKNLPAVLGNPPQIRQVVMNLIINASEAIGEKGGVINVSTSHVTGGLDLAPNSATNLPEGDYLRLEVSGTGCGITEEARTKIFDPFFTADSGRSGALVPFEVGQHSAAMWGRIPLGSGALFGR